jgi:hypothetical protein
MEYQYGAELNLLESQLYTALVSDVLDGMGYRDQAMCLNLNPLAEGQLLAGWVRRRP